ncbi:MAG TPA: peptidase M23, partial [Chryseolinea sp.]|nr:peptidase M23 [Chryseolinea sp.]
MCAGRRIWFFLICCFFSFSVSAQKTKSQLQKEKQENIEKIQEVEKIIGQTSAKKKNSVGELNALNQRIRVQENLITSIKGEVNLLDSEIVENNDIINALEDDLEKLKKEYIAMLFVAQKVGNSTTRLTFLFSAKSFDQLIMRLRYLEQYGQTRKLQADQIVKVQGELSGHVKEIRTRREEKNKLLSQVVTENQNLSGL